MASMLGDRKRAIASQIMDDLSKGEPGGSYSLSGQEGKPLTGYMVGGKSWTLVARPELFDSYTILDYLDAHTVMLSWSTAGVYIGYWVHEGKVYLDIADYVDDRKEAVQLGYLRKEIAVWDNWNQTEIPTTSVDKVS